MMIFTFPMGYILMTIVGLASYGIEHYLGMSFPENEVVLIPLWLGFIAVGYFQWFVVTPKLWLKFRGNSAT